MPRVSSPTVVAAPRFVAVKSASVAFDGMVAADFSLSSVPLPPRSCISLSLYTPGFALLALRCGSCPGLHWVTLAGCLWKADRSAQYVGPLPSSLPGPWEFGKVLPFGSGIRRFLSMATGIVSTILVLSAVVEESKAEQTHSRGVRRHFRWGSRDGVVFDDRAPMKTLFLFAGSRRRLDRRGRFAPAERRVLYCRRRELE